MSLLKEIWETCSESLDLQYKILDRSFDSKRDFAVSNMKINICMLLQSKPSKRCFIYTCTFAVLQKTPHRLTFSCLLLWSPLVLCWPVVLYNFPFVFHNLYLYIKPTQKMKFQRNCFLRYHRIICIGKTKCSS